MAPESRQSKRKAPTAASSPTVKKAKKAAPAATKPKVAAAVPVTSTKPSRPPRKTAADLMSDSEDSDAGWSALKNGKDDKKKKKKTTSKSTNAATAKKKEEKPAPTEENAEDESPEPEADKFALKNVADGAESEIESEDEDQTATLLAGFESSDEDMDDDAEVDGKKVVKTGIPNEKKVKKQLKGLSGREKVTPGIVYLGRIPHGFYEHEMRSYFSQFGTVSRLRLSRNKKTGKSKHYAFIEFADEDVAAIVAETMNNYLLFGHILKCKVVPRDNLEYIEKLMKGANKRFKPRPAAKLAKAELEKKKPEENWEKVLQATNEKRKTMKQKWEAQGIEYEFQAPVAKKAKVVVVVEERVVEVPVTKAVEEAPKKEAEKIVEEEKDEPKKDAPKKAASKKEAPKKAAGPEAQPKAAPKAGKKAKKVKKAKA